MQAPLFTIKVRINGFTPEVEKLQGIGLDGVKTKRTLPFGEKEIHLDIPSDFLTGDEAVAIASPTTIDEVHERRSKSNVGGRRTLFELLIRSCDLVGVVTRKKTTAVLTYLYCGSDINRSSLIWQEAALPAKWASVTFTRRNESSRMSTQTDATEATLVAKSTAKTDSNDSQPTDDEVLARLFTPSSAFLDQRQRLLANLQERGILWSQSAFVSRPSKRNCEPGRNAQVIVQGLFPEAFLRACSSSSSLSAKYGPGMANWLASRTLDLFQIGAALSVSSVGLGGAFMTA